MKSYPNIYFHSREDGVEWVIVVVLSGQEGHDSCDETRQHARHPVQIVHAARVVQAEGWRQARLEFEQDNKRNRFISNFNIKTNILKLVFMLRSE